MYFLKTDSVETEETWTGNIFQTLDAVNEKDLEAAMDVFLNGADMVVAVAYLGFHKGRGQIFSGH